MNEKRTISLPDGSKYVGEYKNGKCNGQGTITYPDGSKYVGEFKDNVFDGEGTLTYSDGTSYRGIWEGGVLISQEIEGKTYLHFPSGIEFPEKLANLERGDIANYELTQPGLGISVGYNMPNINATIYLYNLGFQTIPVGARSGLIVQHLKETIEDIYEAYRRGIYDAVVKLFEERTNIGSPCRILEVLSACLLISQYGEKRISYLYLGGYSNQFLKIRFTYNEKSATQGKETLRLFLIELVNQVSIP
jgi:hypothetical protein